MARILIPVNARTISGLGMMEDPNRRSGRRPGMPPAVIAQAAVMKRGMIYPQVISRETPVWAPLPKKQPVLTRPPVPQWIAPKQPIKQPPVPRWVAPKFQTRGWRLNGLGDDGGGDMTMEYNATTNEPVAIPAPAASADTSSFDWSKLVTALAPVGGQIGTALINSRYAPSGAGSTTTIIQAPAAASAGVSTKTLVIGGAAVLGVLALVFMMKK